MPTVRRNGRTLSQNQFQEMANEVILRGIDDITRVPLEIRQETIQTEEPASQWTTISGPSEKKSSVEEGMVIDFEGVKRKYDECVFYRGNYHHKSSQLIVKEYYTGELIHIEQVRYKIYDFVEYDPVTRKSKGKPSKTRFVKSDNGIFLISVLSVSDEKEYLVTDTDCIGEGFKLSTSRDGYINSDYKEPEFKETRYYPSFKNNSHKLIKSVKDEIQLGIKSPTNLIAEGLPYTMGIEIEVSRGFVHSHIAYRNFNMLCMRDGSINGGDGGAEYVTGVLKGDAGFNHLQKICLELSSKCKVNKSCGVHVHLGNINFTNQFLVNSYVLAKLLEPEIFSLLPHSRRNNGYCRSLKDLKLRVSLDNSKDNLELQEDYLKLFKYISYEKVHNPDFKYNKDTQHPMGPKCSYNHDTPRYCWLNYVPAMFNTRGNKSYSLEVRNHSGTTSFVKIRNWVLLFMAFVAFVERHPDLIKLGITIDDILDKILPKKSKVLKLYFKSRKSKFEGDVEDTHDVFDEVEFKTIKEQIKE